jgi:hypothetical protein
VTLIAGQPSYDTVDKTGHPEHDRTEQRGQDNFDGTAITGQKGHDSLDRSTRKKQPGQACLNR